MHIIIIPLCTQLLYSKIGVNMGYDMFFFLFLFYNTDTLKMDNFELNTFKLQTALCCSGCRLFNNWANVYVHEQ